MRVRAGRVAAAAAQLAAYEAACAARGAELAPAARQLTLEEAAARLVSAVGWEAGI